MPHVPRHLDDHLHGAGPKRILSLDGGGVRGLLTLQVLERLEQVLRDRHDDPRLRLCDYFDLIGGTSTGAIIAAGLAKGMTVAQLQGIYETLPAAIFPSSVRSWFPEALQQAASLAWPKYDAAPLEAALRKHFPDLKLGSPEILTGLAICAKRIDTSSPWVVDNNPRGRYFDGGGAQVPNKYFSLVEVLRASSAAPTYFEPQRIVVADGTPGWFVDGGVSPHNNPALQLLMLATLKGYGYGWTMAPDRLLLVSVGAGIHYNRTTADSYVASTSAPAQVFDALTSLMTDTSEQAELMLQWLSDSPTRRRIDGAVGDLKGDHLAGGPRLSYLRYNAELDEGWLKRVLDVTLTKEQVVAMRALDGKGSLDHLRTVGREVAGRLFREEHLPAEFDLPTISGI